MKGGTKRMDSHDLIDAQFYRAVEIVQGLPKTGPIQTGYEEKLAMYSLYKQATVGNVKSPRPGMWDMLGRAKWDAWAKQKDTDPQQAKWLYVETLLKVLRKYSDKTVARDFVRELESYAGDPSNLIMSGSLAQSSSQGRHSSSGSSRSDSPQNNTLPRPRPQLQPSLRSGSHREDDHDGDGSSSSEDEGPMNLPTNLMNNNIATPSQGIGVGVPRPMSSLSSQMRYRTPLAASTGMGGGNMSSSGTPALPLVQPMPRYTSPSAFAPSVPSGSSPPTLPPSSTSTYPATSVSYPHDLSTPHSIYPSPTHHGHGHQTDFGINMLSIGSGPLGGGIGIGGGSPISVSVSAQAHAQRQSLERAVEVMQASLAALHERLESLESASFTRMGPSTTSSRGGLLQGGSGSLSGGGGGRSQAPIEWDPAQMGSWSLILVPLTKLVRHARTFAVFLSSSPSAVYDHRGQQHSTSPLLAILRRLFLDISFVAFVLVIVSRTWRATGMRRREVLRALGGVWMAVMGKRERVMIERGV